MKRKTKVNVYVLSGNASANVTIEIDAIEEGDLKKEAVILYQLLYDNLPGETYEGLARCMEEASENKLKTETYNYVDRIVAAVHAGVRSKADLEFCGCPVCREALKILGGEQ